MTVMVTERLRLRAWTAGDIDALAAPENVASGRVMEKLGMWHLLTTTDPQFGVPLEVRETTAAAWRRGRP